MNNFSENRLLKVGLESGPGRAPVEAAKPRIDTPQKLEAAKRKLRGEAVKQRQKIEPVRSTKNPREAAVDRHLDKIDAKKFAEMMRDGSVMVDVARRKEVELVSAFSTEQVDKVVDYAVKTPKDLKAFVDGLATQITTRKFCIAQLSDKSRTALIKALSKDAAGSKVLLEKLLATNKSADLTIKTAEESFKSNPQLIENLIRIIGTKKDLLQKLSPTSLATLLNVVGLGDARIFDKLDSTKKSALLFTQLKPELKIKIFDTLTVIDDLAKLDGVALENLIIFAYANPKKLNLLISQFSQNPKIIGKIGLAGCIKLLVETFGKKGQENLQKLLLANISGANKLSIYRIKSIDVRIRMAVWESFSIDMKKKTQKPKNIDQLRKENQALMKKESAAFLKKCADKNYIKCAENKIKSVEGFSIVGRNIKFNIAGVGRSFKKSARFFRELAKSEYDSPLKVKLACYKELLRIIKADRSYYLKGGRYNWHKIAKNKDYAASNAALEASIAKYAELIANLGKGNQAPDKRTLSGRVTVAPAPAAPGRAPRKPGRAPAAPGRTPVAPRKAPEQLAKLIKLAKETIAKLQKVRGSENYKFKVGDEGDIWLNNKKSNTYLGYISLDTDKPKEMECNFTGDKRFTTTNPADVIKRLIRLEKTNSLRAQQTIAKLKKVRGSERYKFVPRSDGTIQVYDKKSGHLLSHIYLSEINGVGKPGEINFLRIDGKFFTSKNPEDIIKAFIKDREACFQRSRQTITKLKKVKGSENYIFNISEEGDYIYIKNKAGLYIGNINLENNGLMAFVCYNEKFNSKETTKPADIIKAIQTYEKSLAKKAPRKKLTPQQVHEKILSNLKEQGIRIILPAGVKLPLLKAMESHDGLQRPVLDIQHAIMDGKDLGKLTKVLKEKGQIIKNYIEKTLGLKKVKIEITINVTKRVQGKETKISKKITWDQNVKENGGFGKVGADLLLGKKGETVYAAPPAVPGEPGAPAGAPVRKPKPRPAARPAAPKAPEAYKTQSEAVSQMVKGLQQLVSTLKSEIDAKYPGICKSLALKETPGKKHPSESSAYELIINGRITGWMITFKTTKIKNAYVPEYYIRRVGKAPMTKNALMRSADGKSKLYKILESRLALGKTVYESREKAANSISKVVLEKLNKISQSFAKVLSDKLGMDASRKITLGKPGGYRKGEYPILIDGKKTNYTLFITTFRNSYRAAKPMYYVPHFRIMGEGLPSVMIKNPSSKDLDTQLTTLLKIVANNKPLTKEAQGRAVKDLEANGLKFLLPEGVTLPTLTVEKYRILSESVRKVSTTVIDGSNVYEIVKGLKNIGKRLLKLGLSDKIQIRFSINVGTRDKVNLKTITWNPKIKNAGGFGIKEKSLIWAPAFKEGQRALGKTINALKYAQYKDNPDKLAIYKKQNRMRQLELRKHEYRQQDLDILRTEYKDRVKKVYKIDKDIAKLKNAKITEYWGRFDKVNKLDSRLQQFPFNVSKGLCPKIGSKMIHRESMWNTSYKIDFEDVFKTIKEHNGWGAVLAKRMIPADHFKSYKTFLNKMKQYEKSDKPSDKIVLKAMLDDVIVPCLELLNAFTELGYSRTAGDIFDSRDRHYFKKQSEIYKHSIPENQQYIIGNLKTLTEFREKRATWWGRLLAKMAGAKKEIYLANMDGRTFKLDQGMFNRYFNPSAAVRMILEKRGNYKLEGNKKVLNEKAILADINDMLFKGYLQLVLREFSPKGKKPSPHAIQQALAKIKANKNQYQIKTFKDIATLGKKHKLAFQLGFIQVQVNKMDEGMRKGLSARINAAFEAAGKDPSKITPGHRRAFEDLLRKGVKPKLLPEILDKTSFGAGILFDSSGKCVGGGLGTGIKLSDGSTLIVAAGITGKPPFVAAQIGINFTLHKSDGHTISTTSTVGINGLSHLYHGSHALGKGVNFKWMAGFALSWQNLMTFGFTGGIGFDWSQAISRYEKRRAKERVGKESGWNKIYLEFSKYTPEKQWQVLQSIPQWAIVKGLMKKYPKHLTKENVLKAYRRHFEDLKHKVGHEATGGISNFPLIPTGIDLSGVAGWTAILGPVGALVGIIGGIKFRLGTIPVFIPTPGETQRLLSLASSARVEAAAAAKIKALVKKLNRGELVGEFLETSGVVYNRPGSKLGKGIRIGKRQIANLNNLTRLATGIESYNKALKDAEVRLKKHNDGRLELVVLNLFNRNGQADRDCEIHIDPTLRKLGVVVQNGRIFIEGNVGDLVITRERFMFSHLQGRGRSSLRDVITIRATSSFKGKQKATRDWIMRNENTYAEILMGEKRYNVRIGASRITEGNTPLRGRFDKSWTKEKWIQALRKHRPDVFKVGGEKLVLSRKNLIEIRDHITKGMHKALQVRVSEDFDKQKLRPNPKAFYEKLRAAYNDRSFYKKYEGIVNNADKVYALLKTKFPKFNERELTTAENYLRNLWFVTAYRASGSLRKLRKSEFGRKYGIDLKLTRRLYRAGFYNLTRLDRVSADEIVKKSKGRITKKEAETVLKALKEYKNRKLSRKELIRKNRTLIKRIRRFKKWVTRKYIQEFSEAINKIDWKGQKPNAKALVKVFMGGIYDKLIAKLKDRKDPLDFRSINLSKIPRGSTLLSGSRIHRKGREVRAFTSTLSYEGTIPGATQIHGYGFLEGYGKAFSLHKGPQEHRQIARILLEMAHPIPKSNIALLKSAFALQVLGMGAYRFIAGKKNYETMIAIVKNPKLANSPKKKYKEAMKQFRELLENIRKAQLAGKPYVHPKKVKGLSITIDFSQTSIVSGAFSKCTNASFYVNLKGKARITRPKPKVVSAYTESVQVARSRAGIANIHFSLFGGVTHTIRKKPPTDGKHHGGGPSEPPPDEGKGRGGGPTVTQSAGGRHITTSGPGSRGGSPSGH